MKFITGRRSVNEILKEILWQKCKWSQMEDLRCKKEWKTKTVVNMGESVNGHWLHKIVIVMCHGP